MESSTRGRLLRRPRMPDEEFSYAIQASGKLAQAAANTHPAGHWDDTEGAIRRPVWVRHPHLPQTYRLQSICGQSGSRSMQRQSQGKIEEEHDSDSTAEHKPKGGRKQKKKRNPRSRRNKEHPVSAPCWLYPCMLRKMSGLCPLGRALNRLPRRTIVKSKDSATARKVTRD